MPSAKWLGVAGIVLATASLSAQTTVTGQKLTPAAIAARRAELQRTLDAYIRGDRTVIGRDIPRRPDALTRAALVNLLSDRHALWQPARVAFALEVAVITSRGGAIGDAVGALTFSRLALSLVIARPTPIGSNAVEDRLEVLSEQIVLALMQGLSAWPMHDDAITAISPRAAQMALLNPPVPSRFALSRAINAAMQCCRSRMSSSGQVISFSISGRSKTPVLPEDAITMYEVAATEPALKVEALVRAAYLEQLMDRSSQALMRLDRASPIADSTLAYAAALIKAGAHDQLGEPDAAAGAYQAAQRLAPNAQVPAIGLAAALQRAGRTDEAVAEAVGARRLPANGFDPWPVFMHADARFIDGWMRDLRALLK
jgi:tetratricopeptide (TPR) repeat protein